VYAPPYRISAIGDPAQLSQQLESDPLVDRFRIFVEDFHLGFTITTKGDVTVPAFRGLVASAARATT
jgi:uncharacterized protein YlxW (UPF0749 family)